MYRYRDLKYRFQRLRILFYLLVSIPINTGKIFMFTIFSFIFRRNIKKKSKYPNYNYPKRLCENWKYYFKKEVKAILCSENKSKNRRGRSIYGLNFWHIQ